ncbi:hypothetical protein HOK51_08500 [Candidatus Woesearchaeota archaeon]|jgi:hypothetical protein|nr:hypothetical protein [Candidatus Woesearchaeota archaeon]MBT6519866.1 hypothetical protein [Candidatus Woesearchaeota archaeon]MBT7367158.1 hypothetical protein [Candidatus Woesearchaeota archaeon]
MAFSKSKNKKKNSSTPKEKGKIRKGLESLVKRYVPLGAVVAFETPIHEGLHAGLAEILPGTDCQGVVLSGDSISSHIFPWLTAGYYQVENLGPGVGGYAKLAMLDDGIVAHLSQAVAIAGPEVATMGVMFYLAGRAMNLAREGGKKIYSTATGLTSMALAASTYHYWKLSSFSPSGGKDHFLFTKTLAAAVMPDAAAEYAAIPLTIVGASAMVYGGIYIASKMDKKFNGDSEEKPKQKLSTYQRSVQERASETKQEGRSKYNPMKYLSKIKLPKFGKNK